MQIKQYIDNASRHYAFVMGRHAFFALHLDTIIVSVFIAGAISLAAMFTVLRSSSRDQITPMQNALEFYYEWIEEKVIKSYGKADKWLISIAFTLFLWILGMNLMDLIPSSSLNFVRAITNKNLYFKIVPTEDINMTLALSVAAMLITNGFYIANHGARGFMTHILFHPFGSWLMPLNLFYNLIEQGTRYFCLAMRLFVNMFSGGLVFLILAILPVWAQIPTVLLWSIIHTGIICIQTLLFTEITIVYINPAPMEFKK